MTFALLLGAFLMGVLWLMVRPLPPKVPTPKKPGGVIGAVRAHKEALSEFYGSAAGQLMPDFGPPPDPAPLEPLSISITELPDRPTDEEVRGDEAAPDETTRSR